MKNLLADIIYESSNDPKSEVVLIVVASILATIFIYLAIQYAVQSHRNNVLLEKVLNNPNSVTRSATFVKSRYLYGIVNPMKHTAYHSGVPYRFIYVKYIDDNGLEKIVKIGHMISEHEFRYVKCLDSITIKTYENLAVIVEDLSNPTVTDKMLIKVQRETGDISFVKPPYYVSTATGKFMVVFASIMGIGALGGSIAQVVFAIKNPDNYLHFIMIAVFCFVMSVSAGVVVYFMLRDVIVDKFGAAHMGTLQSVSWEQNCTTGSASEKVAYVLIDGKTEKAKLKSKEEYIFLSYYIGKNIGVRKIGRIIAIDYDSLGVNPNDLP